MSKLLSSGSAILGVVMGCTLPHALGQEDSAGLQRAMAEIEKFAQRPSDEEILARSWRQDLEWYRTQLERLGTIDSQPVAEQIRVCRFWSGLTTAPA